MTDNTEAIVPERNDTPDTLADDTPNRQNPQTSDTPTSPTTERKGRRFGPSLVLIGVVLIAGLAVGYFALAGRQPEGPTLESRLQQQQQLIDQLQGQLDDLEAGQAARASARDDIASRLDALATRVAASEHFQQDPERQSLPAQLDSLTKRLDELSGSVDLRFGAAQEKEQALETEIEEIRKLQASQQRKASTQRSAPRQAEPRRATPPKPPFNVAGRELRGGRTYLAIASGPVGRLSDLHLIGEGQSVGGWQLTSIEGHVAAFTYNGQRVVISVP